MSPIRQAEAVLAGLFLLAIVLFGFHYKNLRDELADARQDSQFYAGNASAHRTAATEYKTIVVEKEKAHAKLDSALEAHPVWADEPVPDDVADLLRHDSGAARAVPH